MNRRGRAFGPASLTRANILGVAVVAEPFCAVVDATVQTLASRTRNAVCLFPTGAHGIIEARKDPEFRQILNMAELTVADGMPLVRAARSFRQMDAERAFGPDVMLAVLERSLPLGTRHFFYGGRPGVAAKLAAEMTGRFPTLQVAGYYCPPFRPLTPTEEADVAATINRSGADVVWVGLSTPKQERWAAQFRSRIDVRMIVTVGAAFDFHTGSIRPAPRWMKAASLEWLYRLMQEPGRLWRRYSEIVPMFLYHITLQHLQLRRYELEDPGES